MENHSEEKKDLIILKSNDGETFEVATSSVALSVTLKEMMEDDVGNEIPLPNLSGKVLAKVIEYCNKHSDVDGQKDGDSIAKAKDWDKEFIGMFDVNQLFQIVLAANYMNIKGLLDLTCQAIADHIKDMDPKEVREIFQIENDFTKEEEEKIRSENAWAYE